MSSIEEEIAAIDTQLQTLMDLRSRYGALDGDVVVFIKEITEGASVMDNVPSPRDVAQILKLWEEFKARKVQ